MDQKNLVSIFPGRSSDKIFQKVSLTAVTITSGDTPVFGGYQQTATIPHSYGKFPNVLVESSDDQIFWYPAPMGKKTYDTTFDFYTFVFNTTWVSTAADVTFTFFAISDAVPKTIWYRGVLYADK